MDDYGAGHDATPLNRGRRQLVITAQLYRTAAYMSHIDELFQWLANEFVHSFQARVAQFWVQSADRMGQPGSGIAHSICGERPGCGNHPAISERDI